MKLTVREAATLLGRSSRTLRDQLARKEILGVKEKGEWVIPASAETGGGAPAAGRFSPPGGARAGGQRKQVPAWERHFGDGAPPRPPVVFLDEVDALQNEVIASLLRQLRQGFPGRPHSFSWSMALVGLRDIRDFTRGQYGWSCGAGIRGGPRAHRPLPPPQGPTPGDRTQGMAGRRARPAGGGPGATRRLSGGARPGSGMVGCLRPALESAGPSQGRMARRTGSASP